MDAPTIIKNLAKNKNKYIHISVINRHSKKRYFIWIICIIKTSVSEIKYKFVGKKNNQFWIHMHNA